MRSWAMPVVAAGQWGGEVVRLARYFSYAKRGALRSGLERRRAARKRLPATTSMNGSRPPLIRLSISEVTNTVLPARLRPVTPRRTFPSSIRPAREPAWPRA